MKYAIGFALMGLGTVARFKRALSGYFRLNRKWRAAWAMAERRPL